jgi:hypothetical protein
LSEPLKKTQEAKTENQVTKRRVINYVIVCVFAVILVVFVIFETQKNLSFLSGQNIILIVLLGVLIFSTLAMVRKYFQTNK